VVAIAVGSADAQTHAEVATLTGGELRRSGG